ncbi:hypothetical protein GGE61_006261 [Rhizobium leguminosarum]|uniref:hypothetical protein n=1 Tax=Rhizobium leguminosarum TaxID=384 RepID=UPI0014413B20|nr:hypothetical protein [Rhizobium leguminosarum]MBB4389895.1 hypothetical protein [Rhizobium leguminosarum]NKL79085.1 hypothetical protein [Rhizobium leguminosarum bv. viciae]
MRSAVYYPSTQVRSRQVMHSSLLLWDQLHTIVPEPVYEPMYGNSRDMAEAWELIGEKIVPTGAQKGRAHAAIKETLETGLLPPTLYEISQVDQPDDPYEVWPQKFTEETFRLLQNHRLTHLPLPNGDYPFTQEGGLLVMAKLADACAGTTLARVTDRLMAYGMIGTGDQRAGNVTDVVPVTLDLIDASSIPLENLIEFRKREAKERRGRDFTKLRHAYADMVQKQIEALGGAADQTDRDRLTKEYRARMETDLADLRKELQGNFGQLVVTPVVVAAIATGGALLTGFAHEIQAAAAFGLTAALGSTVGDVSKTVAGFVKDRMGFNEKQRGVLARHPMAYMWELSRSRR